MHSYNHRRAARGVHLPGCGGGAQTPFQPTRHHQAFAIPITSFDSHDVGTEHTNNGQHRCGGQQTSINKQRAVPLGLGHQKLDGP